MRILKVLCWAFFVWPVLFTSFRARRDNGDLRTLPVDMPDALRGIPHLMWNITRTRVGSAHIPTGTMCAEIINGKFIDV
ncbi:MAG: hypothetical protein ACKV2V_16750 [Blastocatellia bacterium]